MARRAKQPDDAVRTPPLRERARIAQGGRLVIPAPMRRALQLSDGDAVTLEIEGDRLSVTPALGRVRRAQEILRASAPPAAGRRLSEELVAERHEAAKRGE